MDVVSPFRDVIPPPADVTQVGAPPLMVRTCPVDPRVSPTVLPTRVSPLLKVKRSPKSPVPLLYEIPPVAESEVSPILALNVFQSVRESAPVVVEDARVRDIC